MVARIKRMIGRKRDKSFYDNRYDYLQACYNHMVVYGASESDVDSFLKFSKLSAKHFNDDSLFEQVNRRLNRAGVP